MRACVCHYTLAAMENSPTRSAIDVGSVIADTYTIEGVIGRGGMGAVFLASHKRLPGKKVAIKMLHADMGDDETLKRFEHEAQIASRLGHPNIVAVHDFNTLPDGTPYIVLEYLEGETLGQRLRSGPILLEQALSIVRQIGSALAAAHREGIVHRDLKPANIFLVPTEVDGRIIEIAKVLDFGISKIRGSQTVKTQESSLLGTPQYMAPEQATGQHSAVDERTDVFALGAIVYEMLCGHPAFTGASIPEVVFKVVYEQPPPLAQEAPSLPPSIAATVQQAMAKQAGDRFANVNAFVEALTGQSVSLVRAAAPPPDVGFAAGSHMRSNEAFAQTMGSGDHAAALTGPVAQTGAPVASVRGSAPTMQSENRPPAPSTAPTALPPIAAPRKKSIVPKLLAAVVIVGGAAAAVFFATRGSEQHEKAAKGERFDKLDKEDRKAEVPIEVEKHEAKPPAPRDAGVVVAVAKPDAGVVAVTRPDAGVVAAAKSDAGVVAATKPDAGVAKQPIDGDEQENENDELGQLLTRGEKAIQQHNFRDAEQLANSVLNRSTLPRQQLRARVQLGLIACAKADQGAAQTQLRALEGHGAMRRRVLNACHGAGVLNGLEN